MRDYDVVGYAYEGDTYCEECLSGMGVSRHDEEVFPVFAGEEVTRDVSCGSCGEVLIEAGGDVLDNPRGRRAGGASSAGLAPDGRVLGGMLRASNPGAREIGRHVHDYASAYSFLVGRGGRRKLSHNTTLERVSDHVVNRMMGALKKSASDVIAVVFHDTYIVAYASDGRILLNSGGHRTVTTKQRMNQLLPPGYGVFQRDYSWFVSTPNGEYPFEDGAILYPGAIAEYETP